MDNPTTGRRCRFCLKSIGVTDRICPHCNRDTVTGVVAPPPIVAAPIVSAPQKQLTWRSVRMVLGSLAVLFIAVLIGTSIVARNYGMSPTIEQPPTIEQTGPSLALLASNGHHEYGYWIVEGEVRNISNSPLRLVEAVTAWYQDDDTFISSSSSLIDFNPIMPNQTSPFKTMLRGNPLMSKYSVRFKRYGGGSIQMRDDRRR